MMPVSTPLMLRSEVKPRVSKHDPEGAAPFAHSGPPFETRPRRSSGRSPREACMLREPRSTGEAG
jgi:hypothetical protein